MHWTKSGIALLTILLFSISCISAENSSETEEYIQQNVAPEQLFCSLINNPALRNNPDGEPFAWNACSGADLFVKGYLAWKDTLWLSCAVQYYDFLLEHMSEAPDPDNKQAFKGKYLLHWSFNDTYRLRTVEIVE